MIFIYDIYVRLFKAASKLNPEIDYTLYEFMYMNKTRVVSKTLLEINRTLVSKRELQQILISYIGGRLDRDAITKEMSAEIIRLDEEGMKYEVQEYIK